MAWGDKQCSAEDKIQIKVFLTSKTVSGKLKHGAVREACSKFNLTRKTLLKVRKEVLDVDDKISHSDALKPKTSTRGHKKI